MEIGLGWLGIGLGVVGTAATYLMAVAGAARLSDAEARARTAAACMTGGLTLLITLVFWAIGMRTREPFSPGQTLAWGFLIGGVAGFKAIMLALRFANIEPSLRVNVLRPCSAAFLGILGVSVTYLIFRGNPQDALFGFAIGAAMAAILGSALRGFGDITTETWALFSITTAIGVVLAVNHFDRNSLRMWWPIPILIAATVAVAGLAAAQLALSTRLREKPGALCAVSALVGSILLIGLSAIYSWRIVGTWELLESVAVGIIAAGIIAWLAASAAASDDEHAALEAGIISLLVILAGAVVGFKLWAGLGIALGLLGAWVVLLPALALEGATPRILRGALLFGLGVVLFRLFIELYGPDLGKIDLRVHYTLVGAIVGALTPLYAHFCLRRIQRESSASGFLGLLALGAIGLLAAALPLVLFLIWQIKAVMGLMFGLIVGSGFVAIEALRDSDRQKPHTGALLAIGAQLVAIQFVRPLIEVELTRNVRVWILIAAAVLAIAWLAITRARAHGATEA